MNQIFAIDASGRLASADEVSRGLACGCVCQICGDALLAKQGSVRAWHFAHQSNADCSGGAETLLHQAAKQVILNARALYVPQVMIDRTVEGNDNLTRHDESSWPAGQLDYTNPQAEVNYGKVRPDVQITAAFGIVFIEIAVTNPVSAAKAARLQEMGIPTLEISVDLPRVPGVEAWEAVRLSVLHAPNNRRWIVPEQVRLEAGAFTNSDLSPAQKIQSKNEFRFGRTSVFLRPGKIWLAARVVHTDFAADPLVTGWLARWGGRFDEGRGVWWFRLDHTDRLKASLTILAQRIAQHTPAEQHQRVLDEYYRAHQ